MRRIIALGFIFSIISFSTLIPSIFSGKSDAQTPATNNTTIQVEKDPSVAEGLGERAKASWPWYVTRISGIVASITLIILMLSGIGMLTGHTFTFLEPITAWASHRALGLAFGVSVVLHIGALYFDSFVPFSLVNLLVPFTSNYKEIDLFGVSVGSLYVALGVVSLYLVAIIIITSLVWVEKRPKLWKLVHLLSYITMIFVFVHALNLGTDVSSGIFKLLWILLGIGVMIATLARLWRAKTI